MVWLLKNNLKICDCNFFVKYLKLIFCFLYMETLGNENQQKLAKNAPKYYCKFCKYSTSKKFNYDSHITTTKHIKSISFYNLETFGNENQQKTSTPNYSCKNCNKEFKNRSGLWKHTKKCEFINENIQETKTSVATDLSPEIIKLITELVKGQNGIQESIIELCKNGTTMNNSHNTSTTNSHNKSFNLQFFLNETCKDAMNIMDFVDSIKLQLSDLERIGEIGYVEGISNIIVKNLNALDVTQRPVHCTDKKREVLYVKDENKWEKEDDNKVKMHKVVKKVADKNVKLLPKFKEEYPDCSKSTSKYSDQYNKIIIESMGGSGDNDYEKEEKIIKKITKEVFIDKEPSQTL
jgi:hypothetical protein